MTKGLRRRAINYRNDFMGARRASGSVLRAVRNAVFNAYADLAHHSRRLRCDFDALSEGDLCTHGETKTVRRWPRKIVRCQRCQTAFAVVRDPLDRAEQRHGGDYFLANKDLLYPDGKPHLFNYLMPRTLFLWALGFSEFRPANRRSLDVGCGMGIMPKYMELHGFDAFGVEISEWAVEYARRELGLKNILHGTVQGAAFPADHFSFVSVVHVLEHLDDPVPTLQEVFRVLEPGGWAYVEVPSSERDVSDYGIDDHFWFYSLDSLHRLLGCLGFRNVRIGEGTFEKRLHNVPFIFAAARKP